MLQHDDTIFPVLAVHAHRETTEKDQDASLEIAYVSLLKKLEFEIKRPRRTPSTAN